MTWREMQLTLQLAAEERLGTVQRDRERMVRELEEAAWQKATAVARDLGA